MNANTASLPSAFGEYESPPGSGEGWAEYQDQLRQKLWEQGIPHHVSGNGLVARVEYDQHPPQLRNAHDRTMSGHELDRDSWEQELAGCLARANGCAAMARELLALLEFDVTARDVSYWPLPWVEYHYRLSQRMQLVSGLDQRTTEHLAMWMARDLWKLLREDPASERPDKRVRCWTIRCLPRPIGV